MALFVLVLPLLPLQASQANPCAGSISVHCGGAPSAAMDDSGRLWVAFVQNQHVYVSQSNDLGRSFSPAVPVNAEPEDAEYNGENRPKLIVSGDHLLLSWTTKTSSSFTGEIRFTRSVDGGRSFETPRTINDDNLFTGHRFDSLYLTPSGHLYLTWIDKRELEASLARGETYSGAAIYYAVSTDLGQNFSPNFPVSSNSCECCRIAMANKGQDNVAILWRQVFDDEIRDHAIAVLTPEGTVQELQRASYDDWRINACPHHGPAMVVADQSDQYHISWFSAGDNHQGIYYARYDLAANETLQLQRVDGSPGAGHPYLAKHDNTLYLVWKGFDGLATQLRMQYSNDEGASWSAPQTLLSTSAGSDHPLLFSSANGVYLGWWTEELGYVVRELDQEISNVP